MVDDYEPPGSNGKKKDPPQPKQAQNIDDFHPDRPNVDIDTFVFLMARVGTPVYEIAQCIGVPPDALKKRFKNVLTQAKSEFLWRVKNVVAEKALSPTARDQLKAAALILKNVGDWSEKVQHHHTHELDLTKLSDQELEQLERLHAKAARAIGIQTGEDATKH